METSTSTTLQMERIWLFWKCLKSRTLTLIASFKGLQLLSKYSRLGFALSPVGSVAFGGLVGAGLLSQWSRAVSGTSASPCPTARCVPAQGLLCHQLGWEGQQRLWVTRGLYLRQFSPNRTCAAGGGFARGTGSAASCLPVQPLTPRWWFLLLCCLQEGVEAEHAPALRVSHQWLGCPQITIGWDWNKPVMSRVRQECGVGGI